MENNKNIIDMSARKNMTIIQASIPSNSEIKKLNTKIRQDREFIKNQFFSKKSAF